MTDGTNEPDSGADDGLNRLLAPQGVLRVVINMGNAILTRRDADGGPAGISVDLAREFARRRGLPIDLTTVPNAAASVAAVASGAVDLGFFAVDPARATEVRFTRPWVLIEGWYLVPEASPITDLAGVDRPGNRIAVGRGSAYDLFLSREIREASIERTSTSQEVVAFFLANGYEVAAGIRQQLEADMARHPGLRLLPERFMVIGQALGVPVDRDPKVAELIDAFLAEVRTEGFIDRIIAANRVEGATVA